MRHQLGVSRVGIVVLVAIGALGGAMTWAAQAPPQSDAVVNPLAGNPAAIQAGMRLFDSSGRLPGGKPSQHKDRHEPGTVKQAATMRACS